MAENSEIKWYVVHTYSGYENKVKVNLEKAVENNGMQDVITEVTIPTEEVVEIKNNKRKVVQRKLLPGYVLVKMLMTNETWYIVRNTRGVTGFVGAGNKPTPLSETDFASLFEPRTETRVDIQPGDTVRSSSTWWCRCSSRRRPSSSSSTRSCAKNKALCPGPRPRRAKLIPRLRPGFQGVGGALQRAPLHHIQIRRIPQWQRKLPR